MMNKIRYHGSPPFTTILVHGGPGAAGELFHLAEDLSDCTGIIEPMQTRDTVAGQIEELSEIIDTAIPPITLVGFSWGAWLCILTASRHQERISKLILISSAPFEEKYALSIMKTRLSGLSREERKEVFDLNSALSPLNPDKVLFERFAELMQKADTFEAVGNIPDTQMELDPVINMNVWSEAVSLRRSNMLLKTAEKIRCPIIIIHGENDPHPYEGVKEPLKQLDLELTFHLLEKCGHRPWIEKHAKNEFIRIMKEQITCR
jgi:pimeloyl-ACP methyl ester carboxylesterase